MTLSNIKIKSIEMYHPANKMTNTFYINWYKEKGIDVTSLLENVLGRNERYIINEPNENALTMAISAAKKVLEKEGLSGKDIDVLYFATSTPESLLPSNAMQIHQAIGGGNHTLAMDINANCSGMLVAIENASRYMQANPHVSRSLIVGADSLSLISSPEDPITYANFGDSACAVILEKTEEETGFVDAIYATDTTDVNALSFPVGGGAKFITSKNPNIYIKELAPPVDTIPKTLNLIDTLLSKHGMTMKNIDVICPSQFVKRNIERVREHYDMKEEQLIFVGDKYGYTGVTSPLLALYNGITTGKIKRGDTILFYTIATGHLIIAMIFHY